LIAVAVASEVPVYRSRPAAYPKPVYDEYEPSYKPEYKEPEYKPEYKEPAYKPEYKEPAYKPEYKEPAYKPAYKPEPYHAEPYKPAYKPAYKEVHIRRNYASLQLNGLQLKLYLCIL
jgi:hypothetical protein